jgi:hypothetical protein
VRFKVPLSMKDTILDVTEHAVTNDTLRDELLYWESYLDMDEIYYRTLPGKALAEEYRPDADGIRVMTERLKTGMFEEENAER